jgi:hypothetical protein
MIELSSGIDFISITHDLEPVIRPDRTVNQEMAEWVTSS